MVDDKKRDDAQRQQQADNNKKALDAAAHLDPKAVFEQSILQVCKQHFGPGKGKGGQRLAKPTLVTDTEGQ
eukprot:3677450-Alexandrium_andersonii.AAC.1